MLNGLTRAEWIVVRGRERVSRYLWVAGAASYVKREWAKRAEFNNNAHTAAVVVDPFFLLWL